MKFPSNVEIGKYYEVPHVLCKTFYEWIENVWIPISTPLHDDKEYIKLNVRHYHIDWRFIDTKLYNRVCKEEYRHDLTVKREQAYIVCETDNMGRKNIGDEIIYKRVKCKRQYLNKDFHNVHQKLYHTWPVELQKGYCGKELKQNSEGQYVCPHKGAIIDLTYVDEYGYAVCPAHLLRFDTKTLKAIHSLPNNCDI